MNSTGLFGSHAANAGETPTTPRANAVEINARLNVLRDWTITNVTGIDNAPIAGRESPAADGSWRIGLFYSSGGAGVVKFSNDGLNFA